MMKSIRRSMKGDKDHHHGARLTHMSGKHNAPLTITPPKKVIRAVERYDPQSDQELGFEKGDFFHVIGHENDPDWFEASNPATGARGFVPAPFFQVIGKSERDSQESMMDLRDKDSGYSDHGMPPGRASVGGARVGSPPQSAGRPAKAGSPLYGVVLYDFSAERPDELEAKAGESIIVIAQSNEEWFVAKPIGRLGGPGLIPVDFIEIRDMVTGQAIPDARAAIARAGVPRVEEWKKMAAEYKNSSIALGKFEDSNAPTHAMQHMSLNDNRSTMQSYAAPTDPYRNSRTSTATSQSPGGMLVSPISGSVDSYSYESGRYWYQVNAVMEDGRSWALRRYYEDFYDFQIAILDEFKEEAGHTGQPRILPYMPGPVTYVTDTISAARRASLDDYIKKLLSMPPYISRSRLVKLLFAPRPGDVEVTGRTQHRESSGSHQSSDSSEPSRQSSSQNLASNGYGLSAPPPRLTQGRIPSSAGVVNGAAGHIRTPSDLRPAGMHRNDTGISIASGNSQTTVSSGVANMTKIKIEYDGELIAIRIPQDVTYAMLVDKLRDRIGGGIERIRYRDEMSGRMEEIWNDQDLGEALRSNGKLKLVVS
ncbi:hypothetical protein EX30DRAFT_190928 [Ascodesmis nigricans]|uniref:Uncharacterized protein n=1 Tax=Ascodesmis nigricans TaxID=341454 RepID=A0A4S2N0Z5_9PEZI|nr:hypothetical protein EX30DRAFT_190928 [Ascodesmis nigricans]